jgi:hypothetical protein
MHPNVPPAAAVRDLLVFPFSFALMFAGLVNASLRKLPALSADGMLGAGHYCLIIFPI